MLQAILFDLDGTLLAMDQDEFTNGYMATLTKKTSQYGYDSKELLKALWVGTGAMVKNDGSLSNKDRFWNTFAALLGSRVYEHISVFDSFYSNEFYEAVKFTSPNTENAVEAVRLARQKAEKVILATNPLFPAIAVKTRLEWVGLRTEDFDDITTYENSSYCKPNPAYYTELAARNDLDCTRCLMIGNNVNEDIMPTSGMGMSGYLVTDCLIGDADESKPHGAFPELLKYLSEL